MSVKLELVLPEFDETLRPTFAVPALKDDDAEWMMLIQELPDGTSFDDPPVEETRKWHASPQVRLERLLRETSVPIAKFSPTAGPLLLLPALKWPDQK